MPMGCVKVTIFHQCQAMSQKQHIVWNTKSLPENYLALSPMETILRKRHLNVLTTLYQNACLLVLSLPGSFANKNAIKHKIKVSVLLCRSCLRFWRILQSKCDLEHYSTKKCLNLGVRAQ